MPPPPPNRATPSLYGVSLCGLCLICLSKPCQCTLCSLTSLRLTSLSTQLSLSMQLNLSTQLSLTRACPCVMTACTPHCVGLQGHTFPLCVLDEATQATEPACLVPIMMGKVWTV